MGGEVVAGEAVRRGIRDSKHARLKLYAKEIGVPRSPGCFSALTGGCPMGQTWLPYRSPSRRSSPLRELCVTSDSLRTVIFSGRRRPSSPRKENQDQPI